jgi:hypothetical protein
LPATLDKRDGSIPVQRTADWLVGLVRPDGSIAGAGSINEYYKTVFVLAEAGRSVAAERVLEYVIRRYLREDGDLDGGGCPWFDTYRIYPHAWLVLGAVLRARFDVVRRLLGFLDRFHDARTGGFYTNLAQRDAGGEQEIMTTGVVALAYLWAGRLDVALRTGTWLRNLLDAQPDLSAGLYTVWHAGKGLVRTYPETDALAYRVDARKTVQYYFQYGVPAAFLSSLYAATGQGPWLDLARQFLRASAHCREDVYREPQSGKLGWGAAWTYRLTRDPADRHIAEAVAAGLLASRHADGWWSAANVYQHDEAVTGRPDIAVTAELMAHLGWIADCLAAGG